MLSRFLGKKPDHPMADIKSAQGILNDLPKHDPIKALMELTDWLESVTVNAEFKLDYKLTLIKLMDETAYTYTRKLSQDYFAAHELPSFQENRLWLVLGSWYRHLFTAYFAVFSAFQEGDKGSSALKARIQLLIARIIYAMNASLKFACMHYGPIDYKVWSNLAQMYKFAERQEFFTSPLILYPAMTRTTTIKAEVGHLLAWYGCGVTSLSPVAMHLTDRILDRYLDCIDIQSQPSQHSLFGFDLNSPNLPRRVNIDASVHPYMRFVCMPSMAPKLENMIAVLNKGILPDDLLLGGEYEADLVKEAANYLLKYVTALPQRKAARREIMITAEVVMSFQQALDCNHLDLNFNAGTATQWQLEDISSSGFHTQLPQRGNENVRIGQIIAMRAAGLSSWGVAVVRRLLRDDENHLHVGAEIISNQVAGVLLLKSGGGSTSFENGEAALWLYPKVGEEVAGKINLLMSSYMPNCSLLTELLGKKYLLIPNALKAKHQDCDLVEFRVIEREESEE
jgi:hypothetical protein